MTDFINKRKTSSSKQYVPKTKFKHAFKLWSCMTKLKTLTDYKFMLWQLEIADGTFLLEHDIINKSLLFRVQETIQLFFLDMTSTISEANDQRLWGRCTKILFWQTQLTNNHLFEEIIKKEERGRVLGDDAGEYMCRLLRLILCMILIFLL